MNYEPADYYRRSVANADPRPTITYLQSNPSSTPANLPGQDYSNPLTQSQNVKIIPSEDASRK